jgi:membrane protease YdiL (CAAX protease family)
MGSSAVWRAPIGSAPEVVRATTDARWVRHWRTWASWPLGGDVVAIALLALVVDMVSAWTDVTLGYLGLVGVSPALPIAIVLVARLGVNALGASRASRLAWREYLLGAGGFLAMFAVMFAIRVGTPGDAAGLLVGAFGEEMIYRVAAVIVVGALCAFALGREWRDPARWGLAPGLAGLTAAALLFSALPGHVDQMHGELTFLPFISLSLLLGYVVLRTGAVWPAMMTHALLNLITFVALQREGTSPLRLVFAAVTLSSFVLAADLAGRRLGRINRVPTVIDLEALDEGRVGVS